MKASNSLRLVAIVGALSIGLFTVIGAGCGRRSGRGMSFPEGELAEGKKAFIELGCATCHSVADADLPKPVADPALPFTLGGPSHTPPSDGELFTAIVNPSHKLRTSAPKGEKTVGKEGASRMPDFTEQMTVKQLVDMVAWLQSKHISLVVDLPH